MPISSITGPPFDLMAAYRPIVFQVVASPASGSVPPPVVYCDIYFNGTYYKTISKSQFIDSDGSSGLYQFDIQDAAQEFLGKFLAPSGGSAIVVAPPSFVSCICNFRSSQIDPDGFILPEGAIPVQGTGDTNPTAGGGTASDPVDIINATLQHDQTQEFRAHLALWRLVGSWDPDNRAMPLSHRPLNYFLCPGDNDYFAIVTDKNPARLEIEVLYKDGTTGGSTTDPVCIPIALPVPTLPDAQVGIPYLVTIPIGGTAPFEFVGPPVAPGWMTVAIDGSNLVLSGTPTSDDIGTHIQISVSLSNCAGGDFANFTRFINVTTCVAPTYSGSNALPPVTVGTPYSFSLPLTGTGPFIIVSATIPPFMSILIVGNNLIFTASPVEADVDTGWTVDVEIGNCAATTLVLNLLIDVLQSQNFSLLASFNFRIDSVTGTNVPAIGPTTINGVKRGHHTAMSGNYIATVTGTIVTPTKIDLYVNGSVVAAFQIGTVVGTVITAGTFEFDGIVTTEDDVVTFAIDSGILP